MAEDDCFARSRRRELDWHCKNCGWEKSYHGPSPYIGQSKSQGACDNFEPKEETVKAIEARRTQTST